MALGKAGIPEANAALRALVDDDTYPHRSRYRGVVAHLNMEDIDNDNLESLLSPMIGLPSRMKPKFSQEPLDI